MLFDRFHRIMWYALRSSSNECTSVGIFPDSLSNLFVPPALFYRTDHLPFHKSIIPSSTSLLHSFALACFVCFNFHFHLPVSSLLASPFLPQDFHVVFSCISDFPLFLLLFHPQKRGVVDRISLCICASLHLCVYLYLCICVVLLQCWLPRYKPGESPASLSVLSPFHTLFFYRSVSRRAEQSEKRTGEEGKAEHQSRDSSHVDATRRRAGGREFFVMEMGFLFGTVS